MGLLRKLNYVVNYVFAVGVGGSFFASISFAAVEDSRFELSAEGASVDFDLREVSRRDVLDRLFADRGIKLEWLDRKVADESVSGRFRGPYLSVVRRLLEGTDFTITYESAGGTTRIARVIIVGRSSGNAPPSLPALESIPTRLARQPSIAAAPIRSERAPPISAVTKSAAAAVGRAPVFRSAPGQPAAPTSPGSPGQQSMPASGTAPPNLMAPRPTDAASRPVSPIPSPTGGALLFASSAKRGLLPAPGATGGTSLSIPNTSASAILPIPSGSNGP